MTAKMWKEDGGKRKQRGVDGVLYIEKAAGAAMERPLPERGAPTSSGGRVRGNPVCRGNH